MQFCVRQPKYGAKISALQIGKPLHQKWYEIKIYKCNITSVLCFNGGIKISGWQIGKPLHQKCYKYNK